jgi:hypothetical protein
MTRLSIQDIFDRVEILHNRAVCGQINHTQPFTSQKIYCYDGEAFRVSTANGSFEVMRIEGDNQFRIDTMDWVYVPSEHYRFKSLREQREGFAPMSVEEAWNAISNKP